MRLMRPEEFDYEKIIDIAFKLICYCIMAPLVIDILRVLPG